MHDSATELTGYNAEKHIKREPLKVRVYTPTHVFSGYVHRLSRQRLIDLLNGVLAGSLRVDEEFLPLTEVTVCSPDGREAATQFACVNKVQILFVRESEDSQARGLGEEAGHNLYPVVEKTPVPVKVYVPSHTLIGEMHCAKRQRLSDVLNAGERFLPMTNVEIVPSSGTAQSGIGFVAVNKEQILYLEEV